MLQNMALPGPIRDAISTEAIEQGSTKLNSVQGGIPKFKLLNSTQNQDARNLGCGNHFELKFLPKTNDLVFVSQKHGTQVVHASSKEPVKVSEGGSDVCC